MFAKSSLARATGLVKNARYFRSNVALRDVKSVAAETNLGSTMKTAADSEQVMGPKMHRCSNFDRWLLVWTKKFPSKDQVPEKVALDILHKAQSQGRIRVANVMMIGTLLGCVWAVMSGKKEAKAGHTITQQNMDWHARMNQEYKASLNAPKTT